MRVKRATGKWLEYSTKTKDFEYALPMYRQEWLFKQHQIELSRQTTSKVIGGDKLQRYMWLYYTGTDSLNAYDTTIRLLTQSQWL